MKSILQSLYDGKLYPSALVMPKDPEYHSVNMKIEKEKEYFEEKLSEEDYKRFEALNDLYDRSFIMHETESFISGFKLGALMLIEVFTDKECLCRYSGE